MKQSIQLIMICFTLLSTIACKKDVSPENQSVSIDIMASYVNSTYSEKLELSEITIQVFDLAGKEVFKGETDVQGRVKVPNLAPGRYTIQGTKTYAVDNFNAVSGLSEEFDVIFSSALESYDVNLNSEKSFAVELSNGTYGALVIKQIYYAGSDANKGANFRDHFIEIFNNSETVQYADQLYFAEAHGANSANTTYAYQARSGQYDWSRSFGMPTNIHANSDYVYARTILQLPGNGEQYPVSPGESIVIAATAVNHKQPYQGTDGVGISIQNPELTVDLSQADFEAYYAPYVDRGRPIASDVDNPNVPNVIVHRRAGNATDLILSSNGQHSYIIFRDQNMGPIASWKSYDLPFADGRERTDGMYVQIPVTNIIDAVEIQSSSTTTTYPKKFTAQSDAGWIAVEGGARSSNSVIRKTKEIVNGRRVLMDTNNSTADFVTIKANPRGFAD
ncbi:MULTISPECIES: DUF4876 domain-containing protein [Sphingobacterium]|uniref:DUF4876 domain-containing protein n=1 Tax=Sphingobacterium populi TaxID=1812824 RepID=A0ABW5UGP6_9SPHI|nr:DUF4876 domain-containing protein [Sphingobacterium sp. CFCC 11742]